MGTDSAKGAPWTMVFWEISKKETEWGWALLSRRNWISGKRGVGIWRRQVKVKSRMTQSRQVTAEKPRGTRTKTSCSGYAGGMLQRWFGGRSQRAACVRLSTLDALL